MTKTRLTHWCGVLAVMVVFVGAAMLNGADSFLDTIQSANQAGGQSATKGANGAGAGGLTTPVDQNAQGYTSQHSAYLSAYNRYLSLVRSGDIASRTEIETARREYVTAYNNYLASLRTGASGGTGGTGSASVVVASAERDAYVQAYRNYINLKSGSSEATADQLLAALSEYMTAYRNYLNALNGRSTGASTGTGTGNSTGTGCCTSTSTGSGTATATNTGSGTATATNTGTGISTGTGNLTGTGTGSLTGTGTGTVSSTTAAIAAIKKDIHDRLGVTIAASGTKTLPTGTVVYGSEFSLPEIMSLQKILSDLPASFRAGTSYIQRSSKLLDKYGNERTTTAGLFLTAYDSGIYINSPAYTENEGRDTIVHEMTHAWADTNQALRDQYKNTFWPNGTAKSPSPTTYGNTNFSEDLAESVAMYYIQPQVMRTRYADRYAFIKQYVMGGKEF